MCPCYQSVWYEHKLRHNQAHYAVHWLCVRDLAMQADVWLPSYWQMWRGKDLTFLCLHYRFPGNFVTLPRVSLSSCFGRHTLSRRKELVTRLLVITPGHVEKESNFFSATDSQINCICVCNPLLIISALFLIHFDCQDFRSRLLDSWISGKINSEVSGAKMLLKAAAIAV